jgi:hypothetical protein
VCSYVLAGSRVNGLALSYPSPCVPGREIIRRRLLNGLKGIGGPTTVMIRADIVRAKRPFYNPLNYAGDIEAYLDLLLANDLGFVHEVLTYMRTNEDSKTTSYLGRVGSYYHDDIHEVTKFGPLVLSETEYKARLKQATRTYYRMLGRSVIPFRGREFWDYHRKHVTKMGYSFSYMRVALNAALRVLDLIGNPKRTIESVVQRVSPDRDAGSAEQ